MKKPSRVDICKLPVPMSITGRSSSITNAFFNAIIPVIKPSKDDVEEALKILGMEPNDVRCAYCGGKSTEWDHLRPLIEHQKPTGFITEIANLIPSCGKCNQSKGNSDWFQWMTGSAKLSPKTQNIPDLEERVARIEQYVKWGKPRRFDFEKIIGPEKWKLHLENWNGVLELLKESQVLAAEIRGIVKKQVL